MLRGVDMSRASTERDAAVELMMTAVLNRTFTQVEVEAMLMEAVRRMTVTEMEQLVAECTGFESLMDVEVNL
jgi:hypothetical protein